jgi:PAS domain S-box-containing protein
VAQSQRPAAWLGALDASPNPTFLVNAAARVVFANDAARRRFPAAGDPSLQSDHRPGALLGCASAELPGGCGEQPDCAFCVLRRAMDSAQRGEPVRRDTAYLRLRDGKGQLQDLTVLVSATTVTEALDGHLVVSMEVDGVEAEDTRLRRELMATYALLDAIPVPLFVKGPDRKYLFVNQLAARLMGRPAIDVVGRTDADFFSPAVTAVHWAEDDRVLATGEELAVEEELHGLPGGRHVARVRKRRGLSARGEPLLIAVGTDITDLKRAQDALEQSQRRVEDGLANLRGLLEATDSAIFSVDREFRYTAFNRAHAATMRAIYGAGPELGRPLSDFLTGPADWELARDNIARALAGEQFVAEAYSGEPGRQRLCFEINHAPIRAADGTVTGVAVFARDVTGRRQGELALRESEERLRQANKMEAVGRLAGGVAHDFNNLLTVIMSSAELGLADTMPDSPLREELQEIRGAGERAQAITRQLLAFSRRQVLQPQVVDLNQKVREVERMLGRLLGEDVAVRTHLAPGLHPVFIDPSQLEQVILNLAVNARDAMPRGGKLSIETAEVVLDEEYAEGHHGAAAGPQVMLAISDTGCGMDTATLEQVFEPFFTTKPKGKGTGLGLPTVYGIVKQSGGSIWVYSEPGKGSTFKIYLPRALAAAVEVAPPSEAVRLRARPGETVLVVEDDEQVRRAAVRCLQSFGYAVTAASGLAQATVLLDEGRTFTALLTDVVMPGGNGVEVARCLLARSPSTPVVFMSGYTDDAIAQHGVLSPGSLFLEKPFTPDSLGRKLREALDLAPSRP